ncbi:hypothetical protein GEU84_020195, partial [Fertoebacter nigrum]|nr:hypothetical protein [Fertoeibacter niger]
MAFPAQVFYSILEVSVRWGCSVTQVVNNAIADELDLVTGVSQIMLGEECVAGLISVPGCAVRPLFRPFGKGAKKIYLTEARLTPNGLGCVETPAPTATSDVRGSQQVFLPAWVHATRQWLSYQAREG